MLHITQTDTPREGEDVFNNLDMAVYNRQAFGMFGGKEQPVTLQCANWMAGVILDQFGSDTPMIPADEYSFTAHVSVVVSPPFFAWLSGFGGDIRLIKPQAIAEEYTDYLRTILAGYNHD